MIKQNFIYNLILSFSQIVFPVIVFSYVSHKIGPIGMGRIAFVESICRYAIIFSALGIPIYGVREISKVKNDIAKIKKIFTELFLIHLLFTSLVVLIYLALVFSNKQLNQNINFYLFGLFSIYASVFQIEWLYQGLEKFKYIAIRTIIFRILWFFTVVLYVDNASDTFLFYGLTVGNLVFSAIVNFILLKRIFNEKIFSKVFDLTHHLRPLFILFITSVSITIYVLLDTVMLGFLSSEKYVGIYSVSAKISRIPTILISSLGTVLIPQLSESVGAKNDLRFKELIHKSLNFVYLVSFPIVFLIISLSENLLMIFSGNDYLLGSSCLSMMSISVFLIGLSNIYGLQILTPLSKDKYLTYSVIMGMIVSICSNFFLIPVFGIFGAAISSVMAELTVTVATFYFARRFVNLPIVKKRLLELVYSMPIFLYVYLTKRLFDDDLSIILISTVVSLVYLFFLQIYILKNQFLLDLTMKIKFLLWKIMTT